MPCVIALVVSTLSMACATTTHITVEQEGAHLFVAGIDHGAVSQRGIDVNIPRGVGDVPVRLLDDAGAVLVESVIPRDDIEGWSWAIVVLSVGATLCAVPTLATTALVTMNPALAFAPCLTLLNCSTAPFATVLAAPSCGTIPVVAAAAMLGSTPLLLAFVALTPPREVHIERSGVVRVNGRDGTMRSAKSEPTETSSSTTTLTPSAAGAEPESREERARDAASEEGAARERDVTPEADATDAHPQRY
jgi:hypothetical protein